MHLQIDAGTASNITSIVGRQRRRVVDHNIISRNWSAAVEELLSVSDTDGAFVGRETVVTAGVIECGCADYTNSATCGREVATSEVDIASINSIDIAYGCKDTATHSDIATNATVLAIGREDATAHINIASDG